MNRELSTIRDLYDSLMYDPLHREYYDQSDFYNWGYWDQNTQGQEQACVNLMQQIVALIPEKQGTILDVACGKGATTRYLLRHFQPSNVVAINISEQQLQTARTAASGCQFLLMNAAELAFKDESFENIISVEAAFHFDTREKFLFESHRVLKPGGHLVLSDIIYTRTMEKYNKRIERIGKRNPHVPSANLAKDLDAYTDVYKRAGFQDIRIIDATDECWRGFRRNMIYWIFRNCTPLYNSRKASVGDAGRALIWLFVHSMIVKRYLLVSARKKRT